MSYEIPAELNLRERMIIYPSDADGMKPEDTQIVFTMLDDDRTSVSFDIATIASTGATACLSTVHGLYIGTFHESMNDRQQAFVFDAIVSFAKRSATLHGNADKSLIAEALSLLNECDSIGAMKRFKRYHGMVNRFKCKQCGNLSSSWGNLTGCVKCGSGSYDVVVVMEDE